MLFKGKFWTYGSLQKAKGIIKKGQQLSSLNHDFHYDTIHLTAIWSEVVETKGWTDEWTNAVSHNTSKSIDHWTAEWPSALFD